MADHLIVQSAGGKIQLWIETTAAGGQWHDVTHVRCLNTATSAATFTLTRSSNGDAVGALTFSPDPTPARVALPGGAIRVRMDDEGSPDIGASGYSMSYSGPTW